MKPLFISLGILLAGILGYKNEPSLRYQLTGIRPGKLTKNEQAAAPNGQPAVDPATLTADQLPEKVQLCADVKVTDPVADLTMTIQAGNKVKLVRIEGTNAVVSPGAGPYTGTLPIADTDLMAQLAANPPAAAPTPSTDSTAAVPTPAPTGDSADPATMTQPATDPTATPATDPTATPATDPAATPATDPTATPATDPTATPATDPTATPATDPVATPATDPAATPATDPTATPATDPAATPATDPATTTTPAPATDPASVATPTPTPTTATPAVPRPAGAVGIVPIMQASIRSGQIKEFTFAQVLGWKAEPNETVGGVVFQAGTVAYKAETIFGVKTIQAKALIQGGKVQRWIWPKSGMEIK